MFAAEPHTFADDWPQVLIFGCIFAFLVGFLIRRARARARAEKHERTERLAVLHEEYRPRLHNLGLVVAAIGASLAAAGVGGLIAPWVGGVLAAIVAAPFLVFLIRQQNARIRGIAESVRSRAAEMDEDELAETVTALEEAYGAETMGSLRDLLPPSRVG
jgi:peptidoglycan/LPS O-acetylase OafA/YrhL